MVGGQTQDLLNVQQALRFSLALCSPRNQFCSSICQVPTEPPSPPRTATSPPHQGRISSLGAEDQPMGRGFLCPSWLQGLQTVITEPLPAVPQPRPSLCQQQQAAAPVQWGFPQLS